MTASSHRKHGFTLLELLVVMVIIGLLASYVAPKFFDQVGKSETKAARAQMDAFEKALGAYRLDTGHYPNTAQGLRALVERPADEPKWAGPYLAKLVPADPWGRAYIYQQPGAGNHAEASRTEIHRRAGNHDFELFSHGKDGQAGGTGPDADISIWDSGR